MGYTYKGFIYTEICAITPELEVGTNKNYMFRNYMSGFCVNRVEISVILEFPVHS